VLDKKEELMMNANKVIQSKDAELQASSKATEMLSKERATLQAELNKKLAEIDSIKKSY